MATVKLKGERLNYLESPEMDPAANMKRARAAVREARKRRASYLISGTAARRSQVTRKPR